VQGVFDVAAELYPHPADGSAGNAVEVRVSCVEIYNEHVYDLLGFSSESGDNVNDGPPAGDQQGTFGRAVGHAGASVNGLLGGSHNPSTNTVPTLTLFESAAGGAQIRGLKVLPIRNPEEGLNLLFESQMNRAIAEHQLNDASSRSHCLFTFHFTIRDENSKVRQSKFNIVDLAGSERAKKTEAVGQVQRESSYINKSLSFLEQVRERRGSCCCLFSSSSRKLLCFPRPTKRSP